MENEYIEDEPQAGTVIQQSLTLPSDPEDVFHECFFVGVDVQQLESFYPQ